MIPAPSVPEGQEKPILFSGEMVRAILEGRKTQARCVVKSEIAPLADRIEWNSSVEAFRQWRPSWYSDSGGINSGPDLICPYGRPGDRLWVRETWMSTAGPVLYRANYLPGKHMPTLYDARGWKPSIHMPRSASRLTLEITDVRVERLQQIPWRDAVAEGADIEVCNHSSPAPNGCTDCMNTGILEDPVPAFAALWDSLNASRGYGWDANPWVWVLTFRRSEDAHV